MQSTLSRSPAVLPCRTMHAVYHIPELDGVRGLAILMVLLFHYGDPQQLKFRLIRYGWAGVDLFFVLSGFLITTILLNTKSSPQYFRSFYGRRMLRIFPLYFLALTLYFYVDLPWLVSHQKEIGVSVGAQLSCWFYLLNWHDVTVGMISNLRHLWSLSIEEQFYLLWPLAVCWCSAKRVPLLCLGTITASFLLRLILELNHVNGEFLHRATITRLDTLAFGGLVATIVQNTEWTHWLRKQLKMIVPLACGVLCVAYLTRRLNVLPYTLNGALLALIFSLLVFHCATRAGAYDVICRIARWPPLRSMGKFSYSIYIFHPAVRRYAAPGITKVLARIGLMSWLPGRVVSFIILIMCIATVYLIGLGTWFLFEKHFLKLKDYFPYTMPRSQATPAIG